MSAAGGQDDSLVPLGSEGLLSGKRGLVLGVAGKRSIAWGAAQRLSEAGADLAFACQNEALAARMTDAFAHLSKVPPLICDVEREGDIEAMFAALDRHWDSLDFVVHSIALAERADLSGPYYKVSAEGFARAMLVSCYSFTELCRTAAPRLGDDGSLVSLTYLGAQRTVPDYNVMGVVKAALEASVRYLASDLGPQGVRVNAISAGPVRTASGAAIASARHIFSWSEAAAPLPRLPDAETVGRSVVYLVSPLAAGVTGEIHFVDGGANTVGVPRADTRADTPADNGD